MLRAANAAEAKRIVLGLIPDGSQVHHGASLSLDVSGITDEIDKSGRYEPLRPRIWSMDRQTQADEIRRLSSAPDVMLGSVHAVTETGSLLAASMSGSQLGPYVTGAGRVILVVGTQKIVSDLEEGLRRINEYAFPARGRSRPGGVRHPQRREQGPHHQPGDHARPHHGRLRRRGPRVLAQAKNTEGATSIMAPFSRPSPAAGDSRWLALVVLCAGMLMIVLDATIVNVALPSIRSDLGFAQSSLAWVVNAYLIAFGGVLLLAGRLGDLLGRRRVFLAGLAVFTAASLLCGLSIGPEMLVAARFIQGVGGAMTSAVILGMVVTMFSEPRERARAIGIYSFVAAAGASIGLLAGGFLTQALNWHWIFLVNIPIGIATAFFALRLLESDRGIGLGKGADVVGAFLVTAALLLGVYTIIRTTDFGWGSAHTVGFGAAAIASLIAFVVRESRTANPLVPLRSFRSRNVSGANVVLLLIFAALFGMFFLGSLYFQRVLVYDPLGIGLAFLPFSLSVAILSFASGPLITRFGARAVLLPSLVLMGVGLVFFARVPVEADYVVDVLPSVLPLGVGFGLAFPSLMALGMSAASEHNSGLASGLLMTTQQVGGALGLSVLASLSASQTNGLLAASVAEPAALTNGYQLSFAIGAGLVLVALVVAGTVLRPAEEAEEEALQASDQLVGDPLDGRTAAARFR